MNTDFPVPVLGERGDIADNELPVQALRISQNMFRSEKGRLTIRPGYKLLATGANPGGRIMGIGHFRTAAGDERMIAATPTGVWQYSGSAWVDITGTPLTGSDIHHTRFTIFPVSSVYKVVIMNRINTPKIWDGTAATYTDLGGSPGVAVDGAVCANRLCLLQEPNIIKISEFNNPELYPAGFGMTVRLIDAGDLMVGIDALTRTSIGVLGEESQWVGRAQTGSNPMRFEKIAEESGPMSSAVIVNYGSVLYYLADDYNVYKFDGITCQPVGWAMKSWVQSNISVANKRMAHGAYFDQIGKIFWLFPGTGETGPNLGIHFDPKTGEMGRLVYGRQITASERVRVVVTVTWEDLLPFTWENIAQTYPTWESFGDAASERRVGFGSLDGNVYVSGVGDGSDAGSPIEVLFEVPLKAYAGWPKAIVPSTFETFFRQTGSSTMMELLVGSTDTLMESDLDYQLIDTFDLQTVQRNDIDLTDIKEKRFITVRHRAQVYNGQVEWNGGIFDHESIEIEKGPTGSDA